VSWAQAEPIEIKLGHINQPGSLIDIESQEFATRANAKLGGKAKVVVYNAAQLGNDKDQVNRLKLGTQHIALPSSLMTSILSIAGVYDMPYLIRDRKHADLARDKVILPAINPPPGEKGVQGHRHVGKRLPADHQLLQAGQHPGGPQGHQTACPRGRMALQDVPGVRG
jgi:TRAP-type C4-dicarboxylate transport system substrate-binding protein